MNSQSIPLSQLSKLFPLNLNGFYIGPNLEQTGMTPQLNPLDCSYKKALYYV